MHGSRLIYQQCDFPVFQNRMYHTRDAARSCTRGEIRLVQDLDAGLVYNAAFDPSLMVYDAQYQNEQAHSSCFRNHLNSVAEIVLAHFGHEDIVEVGCGKGYFLEMLQQSGANIKGFDPAYEGQNPVIQRCYFGPDVGVQCEGLVLRHVLEHIPGPFRFLASLRDANRGQGLIYIEVPCLDWICRERAWFDIFYEHVNYFRLADFHRMFGRVISSGHLFSGQYLYVVADLASLRTPQAGPNDTVNFPACFTRGLTALVPTLKRPFVIWGGASKGVIFSLLCEREGYPVDVVIDINPSKQGLYLPATGLRVMAPEEGLSSLAPGTAIHVMNPNYLEEIREITANSFTYVAVSHG